MSAPITVALAKKKKVNVPAKNSSRTCVVHYDRTEDDDLKPLSLRAFESITAANEIRKKSSNPLHRLVNIGNNIPEAYNSDLQGVHTFCYKSFTNTANVQAASYVHRQIQRPVSLIATLVNVNYHVNQLRVQRAVYYSHNISAFFVKKVPQKNAASM